MVLALSLFLLPMLAFPQSWSGSYERVFSFTHPDDGMTWELRLTGVRAGDGRALQFIERVFDWAGNRPCRELVSSFVGDRRCVYTSVDGGLTWGLVRTFDWRVSDCVTLSSGTRLVRMGEPLRWWRLSGGWDGEVRLCGGDAPRYGKGTSQGAGEMCGVVMMSEYNSDDEVEARVCRSLDDGATWEVVFRWPAWSSGALGVPYGERIRHFHMVQPDPFRAGHWYLFSGDQPLHCRVWLTRDDGATWEEVTDPAPRCPDGGIEPELQSVHRATGVLFRGDALVWATDDWMHRDGAMLVEAERPGLAGERLRVRGVAKGPLNLVRTIVDVGGAGYVVLPENNGVDIWPWGRPGVEIGLFTRGGRYVQVGLLEEGLGGFTYSANGWSSVDGVWFTRISVDTVEAGGDYRLGRWELRRVDDLAEVPIGGMAWWLGLVFVVAGLGFWVLSRRAGGPRFQIR